MTTEQLKPAETHGELPAPLEEYGRLTSPEAIDAFVSKMHHERETIADTTYKLEAERQRLDEARTLNVQGVSTDQAEVFATTQVNYNDRERSLRKLSTLTTQRETFWGNHGDMLFEANEDEVRGLIGAVVEGAISKKQPFMPDKVFNGMQDSSQPSIVIEARDEPIQIPLAAVVSAMSFESWETGRGPDHKKDDRSSAEVIRDYAWRDTPIPPLDNAKALILDDGRVIFLSSNAHRAAAAKLRDQRHIQIKELEICVAKPGETLPVALPSQELGYTALNQTVATPEETESTRTRLLARLTRRRSSN